MCSTPFGIIGIRTLAFVGDPPLFRRAQRLSASSEFAHRRLSQRRKMAECAQRLSASSEFALTAESPFFPLLLVLNAFRHHRNSHRPKHGSKEEARNVLNAFRHHRNSHALNHQQGIDRRTLVLNAFRHHRNSHGASRATITTMLACSTPFGIIGIRTGSAGRLAGTESVLNAFRHHRNSHIRLHKPLPGNYLCSTPFGIIGIRTFPPSTCWLSTGCAQRLSASSEFALPMSR